jgi:AraC family transcriptional regulator, transcriptional activator of pobA
LIINKIVKRFFIFIKKFDFSLPLQSNIIIHTNHKIDILTNHKIKTYSTETFRSQYIAPEKPLHNIFKPDFGKFFIVKVEELLQLMKLPVPPTKATTHSLIYLTDGEATMTIGSENFKIFKNECLIVPAGQIFAFDTFDINKGFFCNFHDDMIIGKFGKSELLQDFEFLNVWGNPRITLTDNASKFVGQLLYRILETYSANGLENLEIIQSYFIAALCEINSIYKPLSSSTQTTAIHITNTFKALLFIHIKSKHLVTDYAAMLYITPNHLNKTLKAITGKSPTAWIDDTLVLEAKVLLHQTALSINEVAAEIGIYDQSYFSRLFKKCTGLTPLAFRKKIEKS